MDLDSAVTHFTVFAARVKEVADYRKYGDRTIDAEYLLGLLGYGAEETLEATGVDVAARLKAAGVAPWPSYVR